MRGTVRLGAIGLAVGLMFMAAVPGARAMTPISIFDDFNSFPDSVVGPPALPDQGLAVAFNQNSNPGFTTFPFSNGFNEVREQIKQMLPTFGLVVAANQHGLQIWPFAFDEEEPGHGAPGAPQNGVGDNHENVPNGSQGNGHSGHAGHPGNGSVSTVPEPATWIMMIAGFWIVAWRLRHGGRKRPGLAAA